MDDGVCTYDGHRMTCEIVKYPTLNMGSVGRAIERSENNPSVLARTISVRPSRRQPSSAVPRASKHWAGGVPQRGLTDAA